MKQAAAPSFTLHLATAAPVEVLEAWLAEARPRERAIYASGIDLPHDAPGVRLVRRWADQGLVTCVRQRHPQDRRCWHFMVERVGTGVPGAVEDFSDTAPQVSQSVRARADALLAILRAVPRGQPMPSLTELADRLQLGRGNRGRQKVNHALGLLAKEGAVQVTTVGPRGRTQRIVEVVR